ncbi:SDR family NAD(P)-dependent oxidoreductase [Novosphingobium aureum]|uniref:SDR family NAD(P)-dependent oxidoreductase n=1 Tax=Novosphingobium aureum TaxID=2792964 RepID=UPI002B48A647|nr:SDR family oxidoreductase [Novosphingobium aureum]
MLGGCGGIGRVLVDRALACGLEVTVLDIAASVAAHPRDDARLIPVDFDDEAAMGATFAEIAGGQGGRIDALVSLIGFTNDPAPVGEVPLGQWDAVQQGNLRAVFVACRAALPWLEASGAGSIVLVSSGQGVRPVPGFAPYGVAKAGLIALGRSLALEHAPVVRTNMVAPGAVRTAFLAGGTGREARAGASIEDKASRYGAAIPMGRIAEPLDVVDPVLFLLGPGARFINGETLHVNGGGLMT